jgi:hypothetical protein
MQPDELKYKKSGDRFSAAEYNALVTAARKASSGNHAFNPQGWSDQATNVEKDTWFNEPLFYDGNSTVTYPPWSVFVVKVTNGAPSVANQIQPIAVSVEDLQYLNDNIYLTNGPHEWTSGTSSIGVLRVIGDMKPTRLKIDTSKTVPKQGQYCGPMPGANNGVCLEGCGLFCVAVEYDETSTTGVHAWVIAPRNAPEWLVKPTADIATNTSDVVNVWAGPGGAEVVSSPLISFKAWNVTPRKMPANKLCLCKYLQGNRYLFPFGGGGGSRRATAQISGSDMHSGTSIANISGVATLDGSTDTLPTQANNVFGLAAAVSDLIEIDEDIPNNRWIISQVRHTATLVATSVTWDGMNINMFQYTCVAPHDTTPSVTTVIDTPVVCT